MKLRMALGLFFCMGIASALTCSTNNNPTGVLGQAVGNGNLAGCQQAGVGLTENPDGGPWSDFFVAWNIVDNGSYYTYNYTFSDPGGGGNDQRNISHLILGLSENCTTAVTSSDSSKCLWNLTTGTDGQIQTFGSNGNPGIPGSIFGAKFQASANTFDLSFNSARVPVWQNFYAKDGNTGGRDGEDIYVYNTGFGKPLGATSYYVAAPDTAAIPEPTTYAFVLSLLSSAVVLYRRRRSADTE